MKGFTNFLVKKFINNHEDKASRSIRYSYGRLAGVVGIVANLFLVAIKIFAGIISGSISIFADGINNLGDAGSSIIAFIGIKLSSAPPDKNHPFGHGRIEYIASVGTGILIIIAGFEVGKSSFLKILNPTDTSFSVLISSILLASILMKIWLFFFNKKLANTINSKALHATSIDSRNDVILTSAILLSGAVNHFTGLNIDGYVGVIAAAFVLWSGVEIIRDTINLLIGTAPSPEYVSKVRDMVLSYAGILGVHDIVMHSYGPVNMFISLHAEVSAEIDIIESHEVIDRIEFDMQQRFNATVCIHMDPIDLNDPRTQSLRTMLELVVSEIDKTLSFHDFRVVFGENRTNLIFDLEIPYEYNKTSVLRKDIQRKIWEKDERIFIVATFENPLVQLN